VKLKRKIGTLLYPLLTVAILATLMASPVAVMADSGPNISVSPASQSVANGATFEISLVIDTDTPSRGWQATVNYDTTKLTANSYTQGGFLKDWALAHDDGTSDQSSGIITSGGQPTGQIDLSFIVTGAADPSGPSGSGTLCTISFTAGEDVNAATDITLTNVVVSDIYAQRIDGVTSSDGSVAIGDVPMPRPAIPPTPSPTP
jgi:hypothetical protein